MRVHELAKELGLSSKELLARLRGMDVDVKNHMSALDETAVERVRAQLGAPAPVAPAPAAEPKKPAPTPAAPPPEQKQPAKAKQAAPPAKPKPAAAAVAEPPAEKATVARTDKTIRVRGAVIVRELAEQLGMRPNQLISELMTMNIFASINERLDPKIAQKVVEKHGFVFEHEKRTAEHRPVIKKKAFEEEDEEPDRPEDLMPRAAVVTFLGHVDHGKTSLLDRIRKTAVVEDESGGITQHIGAYTIEVDGQPITFLDTPGHAAFTAMRARGANLTDIAVIVIAADDGVMPQTREALAHARAANVAIMVAVNKIDLPTANVNRVIQQLVELELTPEDYGGQTICCQVSAQTGDGIDHLLEMILLQAEILELKANPKRRARGYVVEAQLEPGMGPTAHLLVKNGTLNVGDAVFCGAYWGRVRALINDHGNMVRSAGPSMPVKCLGLSGVPEASEEFRVCATDKIARGVADSRQQSRAGQQQGPLQKRMSLEDLYQEVKDAGKLELRVILKTDVRGSLEAIEHALKEIQSDKISLSIIMSDVGNINVNDVMLASASNAVVLGFHVAKDGSVDAAAKREGVDIRLHSVIYELIDEIRESMTGMLGPELRERVIGHVAIKQVFDISKAGKVAGCLVSDGRVTAGCRARLKRGDDVRYEGAIVSLKHFQNSVSEVREGQECGIRLDNFSDFSEGDIIEMYDVEKIAQKL
ncbi:MAG: translation initiation factor IF-2 [Kiritimatiellae bacterium]|nr:translation initiation factor IF-2 [Kiritimatiellia bacterium]